MEKIAKKFEHLTRHPQIHEASLWIQDVEGVTHFKSAYQRDFKTSILLASVSKLWTTACIFKACDEGLLNLNDTLDKHLQASSFKHAWLDPTTTIETLLRHQSGYPDYYLGKPIQAFKHVIQEDFAFNFEDEFRWTGELKPPKEAYKQKKSFYADINFTLLGLVLEACYKQPLRDIYKRLISTPLALKQSYLADASHDVPYTYHGHHRFDRPAFIRSCYASGGVISTTEELMTFIRAFYEGKLFSKTWISFEAIHTPLQWSFYPIRYGLGQMVIPVKQLFKDTLYLYGHAGSTGAFAYYCPQSECYIVGDIPQIKSPSRPVRLAMKSAFLSAKT